MSEHVDVFILFVIGFLVPFGMEHILAFWTNDAVTNGDERILMVVTSKNQDLDSACLQDVEICLYVFC